MKSSDGTARDHQEDLDIDGRIILKCISEKQGMIGLDSSGSGYGPVIGSCDHGNEPPGCIKCWEILE
jgi:hypothetical protein